MTPEEVRLLRGMMLHNTRADSPPRPGDDEQATTSLAPHTAALVRIAVLLSVDSDEEAIRWAIDDGIAVGVEDAELVDAFMIVAPVLGTGRLTSVLSKLLSGLDIDVFDTPSHGSDYRSGATGEN